MGYTTVDDDVLEMALSGSVVDGDEVPECDLMEEGEIVGEVDKRLVVSSAAQ